MFGFVKSTFKAGIKLVTPKKEPDPANAGKVKYQCGNPFVKLRLLKAEMLTAPDEME